MARTVALDILDRIEIASPCPVKWEEMQGDDRMRFCGHCSLNVYNISAMTREEAVRLVTGTRGRLCGSIFRRADGTVMTSDCPVGLAAARGRAVAALRRIVAAVAIIVGAGVALGLGKNTSLRLRQAEPFATVCRWLSNAPASQVPVMGVICPPYVAPNTESPASNSQ
jgi:hypothetical protein